MPRVLSALVVCHLLAIAAPAPAQTARDARLIITVTDPSGGVVPNAIVTVVRLDEAMNAAATKPLTTSQTGAITFEGLAAGRYSVRAEFSGFGRACSKYGSARATTGTSSCCRSEHAGLGDPSCRTRRPPPSTLAARRFGRC
jgi:hypothetical protein